MTKAGTKKKRGRPRIETAEREPNGRTMRRADRERRESAMQAVIEARSRALGIWPDPIHRIPGEPEEIWRARSEARTGMIRAAARFVTLPWMGSAIGRALSGEADIASLWGVISDIQKRHAAHLRAIDAKGDPVGVLGRIVAPDQQQDGAEAYESHDPRSEQERAEAAVRAWEAVEAAGMKPIVDTVIADAAAVPTTEPWERAEIPIEVLDWLSRAPVPAMVKLRDILTPTIADKLRPRVGTHIAAGLRRIAYHVEHGRAAKDAAELQGWWVKA